MKILLDTVAFYRLTMRVDHLSPKAQALCRDPENLLFLSSLSAAEIGIKHCSGKFRLPEDPAEFIPKERILHQVLPLELDERSALLLSSLPFIHKDPFDRLLICQALAHDLTIITPDKHIRKYDVKTAW